MGRVLVLPLPSSRTGSTKRLGRPPGETQAPASAKPYAKLEVKLRYSKGSPLPLFQAWVLLLGTTALRCYAMCHAMSSKDAAGRTRDACASLALAWSPSTSLHAVTQRVMVTVVQSGGSGTC